MTPEMLEALRQTHRQERAIGRRVRAWLWCSPVPRVPTVTERLRSAQRGGMLAGFLLGAALAIVAPPVVVGFVALAGAASYAIYQLIGYAFDRAPR